MTERKNIKIDKPLFKRLKRDKGDRQSWPAYFENILERDEDLEGVVERLDRIEARLGALSEQVESVSNAPDPE